MFKSKAGIIIIAASAVAVSGAADTAENILGTATIPAGAMGLNGILRWHAVWTYTNSANVKTLRTRFGGIGGTVYMSVAPTTTSYTRDFRQLANRGAANSQVGVTSVVTSTSFASDAASIITSSVDTTAATTLVFTGQKASAGETLTLEHFLVELITP